MTAKPPKAPPSASRIRPLCMRCKTYEIINEGTCYCPACHELMGKVRGVSINMTSMFDLIQGIVDIELPVPDGLRPFECHFEARSRSFLFFFRHESFQEVPNGGAPPLELATCRRKRPEDKRPICPKCNKRIKHGSLVSFEADAAKVACHAGVCPEES